MAKTATVPARPANKPPVVKSNALPDFMRGDVGRGTENMSPEDIDTPRLKLIQGLSSELEQYNKLRPGHFFHTAAEHIFTEPFRAVTLYYDRRFILWNPRDNGGGILARADDGIHWSPPNSEFEVKLNKVDGGHKVVWKTAPTVVESGLADWGTMNPNDPSSPPAATRMLNFLLAFPDFPDLMPAVFTFQRSGIRVGRKFLAKIKTVRAPLYGMVWQIGSLDETNTNGQTYKGIQVSGAGLVQDKDQYELYKGINEQFSKTGLNIRDIETLQDEDPAGEGAEEPEDEAEKKGGPKGRRY